MCTGIENYLFIIEPMCEPIQERRGPVAVSGSTEERLLQSMAQLGETIEKQSIALEEMRASRDKVDAHVVAALQQMDEHVHRILEKVVINFSPQVEVRPSSSTSALASEPQVRDVDVFAAENASADSAWRKTLLQIVGKGLEANQLHSRLFQELNSRGRESPVPSVPPPEPPPPLPTRSEPSRQAPQNNQETAELNERILKLELDLAAALIDKNVRTVVLFDPNPRFTDDQVKATRHVESNKLRPREGDKGNNPNPNYRADNPEHALATVHEHESEASQPSRVPRTDTASFSVASHNTTSTTSVGSRAPVRIPSHGSGSSQAECSYPVGILEGEAPQRAFIINVRRLTNMQKTFSLLHSLIDSTAIAALTLVQAATTGQFYSSVIFILSVVMVYAMHDNRWDHIEISDMQTLLPLLANDEEDANGLREWNPNSVLKAMSFTASPAWRYIWRVLHVVGLALCTLAWIVLIRLWKHANDHDGENPMEDTIDKWVERLVQEDDDAAVLGMQTLVGTLMFMLHLLFEYIYKREVCGVMPYTKEKKVWDPRKDGVPLSYRFFGLPSMWFTTDAVLRDLYRWMDTAHPTKNISQIYPQEMALFALSGQEERRSLQESLKDAKLFDGKNRMFITNDAGGGEAQSLGIELFYYDEQLKNAEFANPGEFLELGDTGEHMVTRKSITSAAVDMVNTLKQWTQELQLTNANPTSNVRDLEII